MKRKTVLPLSYYKKGLAQPGKGPEWDGIRSYITGREDERKVIASAGGRKVNEVYEQDHKDVCEGVRQAIEDGFDGDTYKDLFTAAGVAHITRRYKDPQTTRKWIRSLLPANIKNKLSRRGRHKKL